MDLTGFEHGLLSDNAFALHFTGKETSIVDVPLAAFQLDGEFPAVFNRNAIREDIMVLAGTGVGRLVLRFHCNAYSFGDFRDHLTKSINFFRFIALFGPDSL